jgi:hypothetical protein
MSVTWMCGLAEIAKVLISLARGSSSAAMARSRAGRALFSPSQQGRQLKLRRNASVQLSGIEPIHKLLLRLVATLVA